MSKQPSVNQYRWRCGETVVCTCPAGTEGRGRSYLHTHEERWVVESTSLCPWIGPTVTTVFVRVSTVVGTERYDGDDGYTYVRTSGRRGVVDHRVHYWTQSWHGTDGDHVHVRTCDRWYWVGMVRRPHSYTSL